MKKMILLSYALLFSAFLGTAQDYKLMVGANGGILGPARVNGGLLYGGGGTFAYAVSPRWVPTIDVGYYTWNTNLSAITTHSFVVNVSGQFYPKEAYKGFYIAPEIGFATYSEKWNGDLGAGYPFRSVTFGADLGWAISLGKRIEFIPHFGYSSWFKGSWGRVTIGTKLAVKI